MSNAEIIKIYTDGACSGNPGKGGWGAILLYNDKEKRINGFDPDTTNNRMELKAVIEALKIIKKNIKIQIYTDSSYVKDGITKWIFNWKKNGWKNSKKQEVKNANLWQELDALVQQYDVEFFWVKGHSGDKYNEIADELARNAF
ncbi:ribonuclease HI [Rickettsiales bacterium]|nr:ribonuclease HI [Rickettsiales bacterium]MDB2550607.1 ribonuclease HI [Rickettsiales bacterium]